MHGLYYEFAKLEAGGELSEATDMGSRRWLYMKVNGDLLELEGTSASRSCEKKLGKVEITCHSRILGTSRLYSN